MNLYEQRQMEQQLAPLKALVWNGVIGDWPHTNYNHQLSMTHPVDRLHQMFLPRWDVQLAVILAGKNVRLEEEP